MKQDSTMNIGEENNKYNRDKSNSSITEELSDEEVKKSISQKRVSLVDSRKPSKESPGNSPTGSGRQSMVGSPSKSSRRSSTMVPNPVVLQSKAPIQRK